MESTQRAGNARLAAKLKWEVQHSRYKNEQQCFWSNSVETEFKFQKVSCSSPGRGEPRNTSDCILSFPIADKTSTTFTYPDYHILVMQNDMSKILALTGLRREKKLS